MAAQLLARGDRVVAFTSITSAPTRTHASLHRGLRDEALVDEPSPKPISCCTWRPSRAYTPTWNARSTSSTSTCWAPGPCCLATHTRRLFASSSEAYGKNTAVLSETSDTRAHNPRAGATPRRWGSYAWAWPETALEQRLSDTSTSTDHAWTPRAGRGQFLGAIRDERPPCSSTVARQCDLLLHRRLTDAPSR